MRNIDYAANFDDFLGQVKKDQPFCFWLGTSEPHRGYDRWERESVPVRIHPKCLFRESFLTIQSFGMISSIIMSRLNTLTKWSLERSVRSKRLANWKIPSWSSQVIMGCLFHGPKPAFMTPVLVFHLPFVGPRGFENPVGFLMHW